MPLRTHSLSLSACYAHAHTHTQNAESVMSCISHYSCVPRSHRTHPTQVLDLCSDDELESVYDLLHAPSPFSPVVKSLVAESEPALLGLRGRVCVVMRVFVCVC